MLKLCQPHDRYSIKAHRKFQLPKCRWSKVISGQRRGICMGNLCKTWFCEQNRGLCWPQIDMCWMFPWREPSWLSGPCCYTSQVIDGHERRWLQVHVSAISHIQNLSFITDLDLGTGYRFWWRQKPIFILISPLITSSDGYAVGYSEQRSLHIVYVNRYQGPGPCLLPKRTVHGWSAFKKLPVS